MNCVYLEEINENPCWRQDIGRFYLGKNVIFTFYKEVNVRHDAFKFVIRDSLIKCLN